MKQTGIRLLSKLSPFAYSIYYLNKMFYLVQIVLSLS